MRPPVILILEDQRLVAETVAMHLRQALGADVAGLYRSMETLQAELPKLKTADVLLIDLQLVDGHPSLESLTALRKENPHLRCIWLTGAVTEAELNLLVAARLDGFVHKDDPSHHLTEAVATVMAGRHYLSPKAKTLVDAKRKNSDSLERILSERELEVLELVGRGLSNDEIGATLRMSSNTAQTHRRNIMGKLGMNTTLALQLYAQRKGLHNIRLGGKPGR